MFCFVELPDEVYDEAIEVARRLIGSLPDFMQENYLEDHLRSGNDISEFFDGTLKRLFDELERARNAGRFRADLPSSFVDTNGSIERLLVYSEVQRQSGAPVRLMPTRIQLMAKLDRLLPRSVLQTLREHDPQKEIEELAEKRLFEGKEVEAPPVFNLVMRELGRSTGTSRSLVDVIEEVRNWNASMQYRDWLWRYYRTYAKPDPLARQRLRDRLAPHLDAMRAAGNGRTLRTATLRFTIGWFGISLPIEIRIPRWNTEDFVGFIGEWYAPEPRPQE